MKIKEYCRPGYFTKQAKADERRMEFDNKNQVIIQNEIPVEFLFIGDSTIQMWELNAYFTGGQGIIINRGIGGDRTEHLKRRFAADALQLKPQHCVLLIGINDSWELEDDYLRQTKGLDIEMVLLAAVKNMQAVLAAAKEAHLDLAVCSILPSGLQGTNHEETRHIYIKHYNARLARLCDDYDLPFIDFYPFFTVSRGDSLKPQLSNDGLHPNVFGYNLMAEVLTDRWNTHRLKRIYMKR